MKWKKWLENWDMTSLKVNLRFLEMDWEPKDADRTAAWELYVELLTRITTQPLGELEGNERVALDSVCAVFPLTRETIRRNGRECIEFAKIAVIVLNQIIRPFTARWHQKSLAQAFNDSSECATFRNELEAVQQQLRRYTRMLADMAGVEDLTTLEAAALE